MSATVIAGRCARGLARPDKREPLQQLAQGMEPTSLHRVQWAMRFDFSTSTRRIPRLCSIALLPAVWVIACGPPRPTPSPDPATAPPSQLAPPPLERARLLAAFDSQPTDQATSPTARTLPMPPLKIVEWGPRGRATATRSLFLRFAEPLVGLDQSADSEHPPGSAPQPAIEISPPLPGKGYFQTPERWVFDFDDAPKPATRYSVRLRPPLVAASGARWDGVAGPREARDLQWDFESERPRVDGVRSTEEGQRRSRTAPLLIEFTQRVAAAQVAPFFQAHDLATGKAGPALPLRIVQATRDDLKRYAGHDTADPSEPSRWVKLQPQGLWPVGAKIRVQLRPGWLGEEGPLPADTPWETEFRVIPALKLLRTPCSATAPCGQEPIVLHFSTDIPYDEANKVRITPKPDWLTVTTESGWASSEDEEPSQADANSGPRIEIHGAFLPDQRYRVQIGGDLRDEYQQSLGKPIDFTAVFVRRPFLELSADHGILREGVPQTVGVASRFVQSIEVRAQILDDNAAMRLLQDETATSAAHSGHEEDKSAHQLPAPDPQFVRRFQLTPKGPTDWSSLALDLAELSGRSSGALLIEVLPTALVASAAHLRPPPPVRGLLRLTDLGPQLTGSRPRSLLRVHRLSDGTPVAGAEITRREGQKPGVVLGRTDAHGVLSVPTSDDANWAHVPSLFVITAPKKAAGTSSPLAPDRAYLAVQHRGRESDGQPADARSTLRRGEQVLGQIVTERDAYRPGEVVRCVGWSAIESPYVQSSLRRVPAEQTVTLTLQDNQQRTVETREIKTTPEGKFFAELPLPENAKLGHYSLRADLLGHAMHARVKVEDYRTPEYAVSAAPDRGEVVHPDRPQIRVAATYFFGGDVALVRGSAAQACAPTQFRPPRLEADWRTGTSEVDADSSSGLFDLLTPRTGSAQKPRGRLQFTAPATAPHVTPRRCTVSVSVADASNQAIGAEARYLSHPALYYLALRPSATWLQAGDTLSYAVRAVQADGTRVAANGVKVVVERIYSEPLYRTVDQKRIFDRYEEHSESAPGCTLTLSAAGPDAGCRIPDLREGRYVLRVFGGPDASLARMRTEVHVRPRDRQPVYVPPPPPPRLDLWLARDRALPGEEIVGRISAPWPARGVVILSRHGVREHIPFDIPQEQGGSVPLNLRIDDTWIPAVQIDVRAVRPAQPGKHTRPSIETTSKQVQIDPAQRRLYVQVDAPSESLPGQKIPIRVRIRDHAEQPTTARVAVWAVDEAVLSLTNYEVPDLLPKFIPGRDARIADQDEFSAILFPYVATNDPWLTPMLSSRSGFGRGMCSLSGSSRGFGGLGVSPSARQRFETTPLFLGDVAVDESGEAVLHAQLPDNLTTFRITAVASARLVDGQSPGRFGKGDTRLRVSQPFLVRAALPRLLHVGDQAELAALINNLAGPSGQANVSLSIHQDDAHPVLQIQGPHTRQRSLMAGDIARLPFTVTAQRAGQVELTLQATLRAATGASPALLSDSVRLPLSVAAVPRVRERVAIYGTLDDDQPVALPLRQPVASRSDEGGLRITTSPSLLRDLDSAAQSLIEYPHGCLEQTSSRLIPLVALADIQRFLPRSGSQNDAPTLARFVRSGVDRIAAMQTESGGFAYWPGGRTPHVYASAYATWVLHLLRQSQAGAAADLAPRLDALIGRSSEYLLNTLSPKNAEDGGVAPALQGQLDLVRSMLAMQVLADLGRAPPAVFDVLFARRSEVPVFAQALLTMALQRAQPTDPRVQTLSQELLGTLGELPATAHVNEVTAARMDALFYSSARSDAMVLSALLRTRRDHPLIPKLVRGLVSRRSNGAWRNTQENAYAILALAEYGRAFEAAEPALLLRAWAGTQAVVGSPVRFTDRAAAPVDLHVPMPILVSASREAQGALLLQREGSGRLYYRIELSYTPSAPLVSLPARTQGLRILRSLRTRTTDRATSLSLGEPAVIDLTFENRVALHYVAIDVPLPAGLEVLQRDLGFGQASLMLSGPRSSFVAHEELRADRIAVFADHLPPGTHRHTIYVRPTTPGRYILPSAQAEAMYEPEVYGRSTVSEIDVRE